MNQINLFFLKKKKFKTLAVLAAIEDIIDESSKKRSPTTYFASLMTFLEQQQSVSTEENFTNAVFQLLAIIFKRLSPMVLRAKFSEITIIISSTLENHFESALIVRHVRLLLFF